MRLEADAVAVGVSRLSLLLLAMVMCCAQSSLFVVTRLLQTACYCDRGIRLMRRRLMQLRCRLLLLMLRLLYLMMRMMMSVIRDCRLQTTAAISCNDCTVPAKLTCMCINSLYQSLNLAAFLQSITITRVTLKYSCCYNPSTLFRQRVPYGTFNGSMPW